MVKLGGRGARRGLMIIVSVVACLALVAPGQASAALGWGAPVRVTNGLLSVSCPSVSLCFAGGNAGEVAASTDLGGGSGAWIVTNVDSSSGPYLYGVSCPSLSLCVAVDYSGNVLTTTNPLGGTSAWTLTNVDASNPLGAVSCPSVSFCVAVDTAGNVVTSIDPTGGVGSWTAAHIDDATVPCSHITCQALLDGVSCPSASLCVAVDDAGYVFSSANPSAGPSAWTATTPLVPPAYSHSPGERYATVSCPSSSFCIATEYNGDVFTSTNPTGGAAAWTATNLNDLYGLSAVACGSTSLCAVADGHGNVLTSANPLAGATAWTTTNIDGTNALTGIACPSASLCAAVDDQGEVVVGASPPSTVQSPSTLRIRALLRRELTASGRSARIGALRKHAGYSFWCKALTAGRLRISWYLVPHDARLARAKPAPTRIATGSARFADASTSHMNIKLTHEGKKLLKRAKHLKVTAKGSFAPTSIRAITATRTFRLSR